MRVTGFSLKLGPFTINLGLGSEDKLHLTQIIRELSDRRVLYASHEHENAAAMIDSVSEIREFLREKRQKLLPNSQLDGYLAAFQAACREFLQTCEEIRRKVVDFEKNAREAQKAGRAIDSYQQRLLQHYDRVGDADIRSNYQLRIDEIWPLGYSQEFCIAVGRFRGIVGTLLQTVCSHFDVQVPAELLVLTERDEQ